MTGRMQDPKKKPRRGPRNTGTTAAPSADLPETPSPPTPLIVGIGASAGGLNAFTAFFAKMPTDSGLAFVLVQHLDPVHKSMLVDLLSRHTTIPVMEAENGTPVVANRVYVIPPDATLTIREATLYVEKPAPARQNRRPIDTFFSSLAEDQEERAICIVLSGTGTDGTLGLTAIKEHGGLTMAQSEGGSPTAMTGMPNSAAATGLVDHVMPVEDMPAALIEYKRHLAAVAERAGDGGHRQNVGEYLPTIGALLRAGTGHDFTQYKPNTMIRRIQRRMQVLRLDSVPALIDLLRREPHQIDLLFREFLIGVTQFFRDPETFEALADSVIPKLLENKGPGDQVRIWVPGCATGEEVYSIAILLKEAIDRQGAAPQVQIFGTDINDAAVATARTGRYRKEMAGLSPERAERWFIADGENHYPSKAIREMCVFSTHSVVKDPPFSKLDLISCRNLMIYLDADLQSRVIRTFHYALRPGGFLCLGQSEGISRNTNLFATVDKKHRIFQHRDTAAPSLPVLAAATPRIPTLPTAPAAAPRAEDRIDLAARRVMEKYSPAYVVIDKNDEIVRFSGGGIARYLEPSTGTASLQLFAIIRPALRPALRSALQNARAGKDPSGPSTPKGATIKIDGIRCSVDLIVEPIAESGAESGHCLVAFRETAVAVAIGASKAPDASPHSDHEALERDLQSTKAQLQAAIDELEAANEEMKSSTEEYQSVNEELQSSNEELETAKEEMQSVNEELQTINAEMGSKNEMLTRANSDIKNLLDSTQIATIFLDGKLRVKTFTPGATELVHLRESDHGRPITEIVTRMSYTELPADVAKVLRTRSIVEREVRLPEDDATFLMRMLPYRTSDNVIDGVVITFIDISEHKRYEDARARLAAIVDSSEDAIIGHAFDGTISSWNPGAERIFGFTAEEAIGKSLSILLPPGQHDEVTQIAEKLKRGERIEHFEIDRTRKDGQKIDVSIKISPIRDNKGNVTAASTIAREFTERKLIEDHKSLLLAELDHRVRNTLTVVTSLISQTLRSADPKEFAEIIEGRIQALSRVHGLLTQSNWDRAELREIVMSELAPYRSEKNANIVIDGQDTIVLTPKTTLTLAMALHELATNSAKYGALSVGTGQVAIRWSVAGTEADRRLTIEWKETGGPPVKVPKRRGFGSQLIERTIVYELDGSATRQFLAEGVQCRIEFPLTESAGYVQTERHEI